MSEAVPSRWQYRSLNSLGEYKNGFAFNELHWSEHGLPIVRIAQITGSQGIVDRYPGRLPDTFRINNDDLIFSWSGTLAVVRWTGGPAWLNQHLFKVVPAGGVKSSLLFHLLQASVAEMDKRTHGSTMKHIKRGELREFFVSLPIDENEQEKIAEILDNLDTAIQETEAIIAKLKAVKQGLLHDLLTRGIDANGELRPPQTEAPHLYKQSTLGWIPIEWDVDLISDLTESSVIGPFGSNLVASDYQASGVPVIFVRDVRPGCFFWKSNVYVSERKAQALSAHGVVAGDVVATKMGLPPCVAAVYPASMPNGVVTADIVRLRPKLDRMHPIWMSFFINSPVVARQVEQITAGVTRPKVTLRDVRDLSLAVPSLREQQGILGRIHAMESRIQMEEKALKKFTAEKSGLMDDLLTGRVRVTPLLEGTPA